MNPENEALLTPAPKKETSWLWTRLRYYVPVLAWLPAYQASQLAGDVAAGLTVACLLIPQALSYAQAILKIPPVYGLYTCFVPLLVYSLLGTSRQLGVGPEALVSILVAAAIAESPVAATPQEQVANSIAIAAMMGLLVGIFTFLLGFFRLGFLDSVLSRALLRGFITAVAVVVMIDQSPMLLRISEAEIHSLKPNPSHPPLSPIELLFHMLESLPKAHIPTTIISVCSIAFLVSMKSLKKAYARLQMIPEILLLVVGSTALSCIFRWDLLGVEVMKDVEGGFKAPSLPVMTLARVRFYILSAILISVIGFVESIAIAKTYATKYNYPISPNRELVAIGVANILGSCFGGWPAFGSLGRSAVNDAAGARSQIAGLVTAIVVLFATLFLLPLFYFLPKSVCSSIIVVAATKLIEPEDIHFIFKVRAWNDLGLLLLTFLTTLFVSIEVGTLISVGTSLLLVLKHTTKTRIAILGRNIHPDTTTGTVKQKFRNMKDHTTDGSTIEPVPGCLILRIEEGLFFGNCGQLKDRLKRIEMYGELNVHPGEAPRRAGATAAAAAAAARRREGSSQSVGPERIRSMDQPNESPRQAPSSRGDDMEADEMFNEMFESGQIKPLSDADSDLMGVIFDVGAVTAIDASATQTLVEIVESYHTRRILVCFVKLRDTCKPWFSRSGITSLVTPSMFFDKIADAVECIQTHSFANDTLDIQVSAPPVVEAPPSRQRRASVASVQAVPPPIRFVGMDPDYDTDSRMHPVGTWGAQDSHRAFLPRVPASATPSAEFAGAFVVDRVGGYDSDGVVTGGPLERARDRLMETQRGSQFFGTDSENEGEYGGDNVWD
ncbi:hypothetical protein HDU98_006191 [Podochytrium sp. JEL0797]|nr:hypothetical protein HDU98_006191 [Podochytrium sp. JEL0797]